MTLDEWFHAGTLPDLRRAVLAAAVAAGMPDDRAHDVVLAVHELAANAVCYGGGAGRLRMQAALGELHCYVSDAGWDATDARSRTGDDADARIWTGDDADARTLTGSTVTVRQWLIRPGHGLWLVRDLADHLSIVPRPAGSEVTAVFTLPDFRGGRAVR